VNEKRENHRHYPRSRGNLLHYPLLSPGAQGVAGQTAVAPEWSLKDADGKTVHSSDFKGKVVILDFWATWCPPCKAEIPGFIALQNEYGKKGLVVVGISVMKVAQPS